MKFCKIIIKGFHQFQNFEMNLTNPHTGEPLDKFCLIGANGTGKTMILKIINTLIINLSGSYATNDISHFDKESDVFYSTQKKFTPKGILAEIKTNQKNYYLLRFSASTLGRFTTFFFAKDKIKEFDLERAFHELFSFSEKASFKKQSLIFLEKIKPFEVSDEEVYSKIGFDVSQSNLLIYAPPEGNENQYQELKDVPNVNLNDALGLFRQFPYAHVVSPDHVADFWKTLIYHIKKRDNDFRDFQNRSENLDRTVREIKEEFNQKNPDILKELAKIWDKILLKAGLEFDYENARNPIQLTENLKAYIRLKSTKKYIQYNQLSTGIRIFIFKLGHIFSLYFNRNIERGILLVDEPENSLYPDFLYDLVETYEGIVQNTQIGMATHSSIIAAQFEPYERLILAFDEEGTVKVRRGNVPVGDDPNDILIKDFGIRSLLGKKGVENWERYVTLKTLIPRETNEKQKNEMIIEFSEIGRAYNFGN